MAGYQDDDMNEPGESMEGEGCRPTSGNDANVAVGLKGNARGDTRNSAGAKRSSKRVILLN